ncbi:HlyD family secretion protein [Undibacterium fentianense]|uniref:HlyD family efflux transporter periplasmic adaptor subunit n=1 Tax=Undibacterium fentianense TaxID=2828728 RepID=A0A941DWZ2_9BURK|nr:HlyD family efflux transporter periplasmic adaptor subunit [Undibacterium fentianense]MBR7798909.1 HlyD family efflux transporter periplasmic adaptor subunit [Undibacterium fentianense]
MLKTYSARGFASDQGRLCMRRLALHLCLFVFSVGYVSAADKVASASATSASSVPRPSTALGTSGKAAKTRPVLFAGELRANDSQPIPIPSSNVSPVNIRYFVPEGTQVKRGDVVLRIDARAGADLDRIALEMTQAKQTNAREVAELEVRQIEAERALILAKAALGKAKVDAALPKAQIAALDYDKYQGELERSKRDLEVKEKALAIAKEAIHRKLEDGKLAVRKIEVQQAFAKANMAQAEVRATRDGVVIHGYDHWSGRRLDEGGMGQVGTTAGYVMGSGDLQIYAYLLEVDRPFVKLGQELIARFDAFPSVAVKARIESIVGAPEAKASWGKGRYFKTIVNIAESHSLPLQHGMSVALELASQTQANQVSTRSKPNISNKSINLEADVLSRQSSALSPPSIQNVWEYNLVMLAPEGKQVKAGEPVAVFEANEVQTRVEGHRSTFKEKQRALEKLKLDHAEVLRAADLTVSEAKSNAEKAERKAQMPRELVKRVDYDKLVIDREMFAQLALLAARQRDAQKRAKEQEVLGMKTEIAQLHATIETLDKGIRDLTVLAPRAGTVIHLNNFNGEKIAVGSRVFMSSTVANLADPDRLFVQAKVPEAQVSMIKLGQLAKVTVPGANTVLSAKITAMGAVFHGKSSSQPIVVRDIELEFIEPPKAVKPGTTVQVQLDSETSNAGASSATTTKGAK